MKVTGQGRRWGKQLLLYSKRNNTILYTVWGSTRSHTVENSLWNRQRNSGKANIIRDSAICTAVSNNSCNISPSTKLPLFAELFVLPVYFAGLGVCQALDRQNKTWHIKYPVRW